MRRWLSLASAMVALAWLVSVAGAAAVDMLPPSGAVEGWAWREPAGTYGPGNLYELIDGNADLFLAYGFCEAAVADLVKGEEWIRVDVYDMGTPLQAFGLYGAEKAEGVEELPVGRQGYWSEGLLAFWQGQYYVKVAVIGGESGDAARKLGDVVAQRIGGEKAFPSEVKRLPVEGRVAGSERYAKRNALGHKALVEAVSASYSIEKAVATLYVADLGTEEKAKAALTGLREFAAGGGTKVSEVAGMGEGAFGATDPYYGEMVYARQGQYVLIAMGEKAGRPGLVELVERGLEVLREAASRQEGRSHEG